ncbi:MAG: acyl-CoA thioesterase, partial [Pseudomonadota bacterium]
PSERRMSTVLADLLQLLDLERLEMNLFRGVSRDIGSPQVFGGQVLGQALMAATRTVGPERPVHSLHSYFLRRGDFNAPIVYEVDRSRDGASFTNRRVVAIQHGQQIFHLSASFQVQENGPDHQVAAPEVTPPEELPDLTATVRRRLQDMPDERRRFWERDRPFEFRSVEAIDEGRPRPGVRHIWFRLAGQCPDDAVLHRCLLAYVSDFHLLETATLPHGLSFQTGGVLLASLDHGMSFHRPFRIDDWLLYALISPSSSGSRGMAFGRVFDRAGQLVASTAQEGLMRVREG